MVDLRGDRLGTRSVNDSREQPSGTHETITESNESCSNNRGGQDGLCSDDRSQAMDRADATDSKSASKRKKLPKTRILWTDEEVSAETTEQTAVDNEITVEN